MDKQAIEEFRKQIEQLQQELQATASASLDAAKTVTLDQSAVGRVSRMDAMQQQQMALETERRRQLQLQQVEGAFRRLDSGDFGYCYQCGEEINLDRLRLNPLITRCLECVEE